MQTGQKVSMVDEQLQEVYDDYYAEGQSEWRRLGAKHKADNIVTMCSSIPHSNIVDIGAGEGSVSAELARRGFADRISCLEISASGVEVIKKRQLPVVSEAKQFDGYRIPYPDDVFDLAITSHVLEHVEHERVFLSEAKRVARYLFVEVPLEDTYRLPIDFRRNRVGHINFYNFKTIRRLLQTCGLEVLDQRLFDAPLDVLAFGGKARGTAVFVMRRLAGSVNHHLAARYFTHHCGLLCRKVT